MARKTDGNRIRVGVIGVGRGMSFAQGAPFVGMELVALCDTWEAKLREAGKKVKRYDLHRLRSISLPRHGRGCAGELLSSARSLCRQSP